MIRHDNCRCMTVPEMPTITEAHWDLVQQRLLAVGLFRRHPWGWLFGRSYPHRRDRPPHLVTPPLTPHPYLQSRSTKWTSRKEERKERSDDY